MNVQPGSAQIILADPPWLYRDKATAGERGVDYKYSTMSPADIARLQVGRLANRDAILYLWVTAPQLPVGLAVMKAWGFEFKTVAFTWVKLTADGARPRMGMGNYTRSNAEFVLLGRRGRGVPVVDRGVNSVILAPRREHSRKPDEVRERIVQIHGNRPRVELFARPTGARGEAGWAMWGHDYGLRVHRHDEAGVINEILTGGAL